MDFLENLSEDTLTVFQEAHVTKSSRKKNQIFPHTDISLKLLNQLLKEKKEKTKTIRILSYRF